MEIKFNSVQISTHHLDYCRFRAAAHRMRGSKVELSIRRQSQRRDPGACFHWSSLGEFGDSDNDQSAHVMVFCHVVYLPNITGHCLSQGLF